MHDEAHARLLAGLGRLEEGSPEAVALMIMLGIDGLFRRDYAAMRSWSQRALDAARDVDDPTLHACAAALVAWGCVCDGDAETAGRACDESAALVDGLSDDELARSLEHGGAALAAAELYLGRCDDAAAHAERALAVARAAGRGELSPVLFWAGTVRAGRGRLPEAAEIFEPRSRAAASRATSRRSPGTSRAGRSRRSRRAKRPRRVRRGGGGGDAGGARRGAAGDVGGIRARRCARARRRAGASCGPAARVRRRCGAAAVPGELARRGV